MNPFINLGLALIVGVVCGKLMNRLKVPAVAGYIIAGLILGASGLKSSTAIQLTNFLF